MIRSRVLGLAVATLLSVPAFAEGPAARRFELTTKSAEAKKLLGELQARVENFQGGGAASLEMAQKLAAADPSFALGIYYRSVFEANQEEAVKIYRQSRELAKRASDGERRFIEGMSWAREAQGAEFKKSIEPLEALAKDYPGERLVFMILGQLYNGAARGEDARRAFARAKEIGPTSPRIEAFLAGADLLKGRYAEARVAYEGVEKSLPKGAVPFAIRFGVTFSHLYEGHVDEALKSLETYLGEYRANGLDQQFPEVFIWNAMGRINLENGRLDAAMKAYEKGYESVPRSSLSENDKKTWLGRLHHGKCRVLARMGKIEEAWREADTVKQMIETGGEEGKQYWPAYHYLAGYVKLEAGDAAQAIEHLKQAEPDNPFHQLLLARAYEKAGKKDEAKKAYRQIVESQWAGIELPLAFPEARRKLAS